MLTHLTIENVVLIEKLALEFSGGLSALTGETGAGKSILLDSLGLAIGLRAESGLVRTGADKAVVTAMFEVPAGHDSENLLQEQEITPEDALIIRRVVNSDGRSRAFVNDQPVSVGFLKNLGETLVEIHGQFDTQALLNPATHRALLDSYARVDVAALTGLWEAWKATERKLETARQNAAQAQAEEVYLRQACEDLDALVPEEGEEARLSDIRTRLMGRDQLLEALNGANDILSGQSDPVTQAAALLDRVAAKGGQPIGEALAALDRAAAETQEALSLIASASADLEESEHDLVRIDDRLFALKAQARKFGCSVDELPAKHTEFQEKLSLIEGGTEALDMMVKDVEEARTVWHQAAVRISEERQTAAEKLDALVNAELPPLKLERAQFKTEVAALDESAWGPEGLDRVRFLVATNPGVLPGALDKIASGGEMARFMLALKAVLADCGAAQTLVFDEVDTGIGGATASAVGTRLAALGAAKQVLVVTHSPQVAARAETHYRVEKEDQGGITRTSVRPLENDTLRREEIARMLSGASVTDEARHAADRLLESEAA